ncbi:MAG: DUF433 domain-containing protein [Caldilineaceae bacterium]
MTIAEIESELKTLNRSEKAQIVQRLIVDIANAWPGIEKTPGVIGGDACIVRTRIPVWMLENYRRLGWTEAQILDNFPTLRAADLVNAWAYVDAHQVEIETTIHEHEMA